VGVLSIPNGVPVPGSVFRFNISSAFFCFLSATFFFANLKSSGVISSTTSSPRSSRIFAKARI